MSAQVIDHTPVIRFGLIGGYNYANVKDVSSENFDFNNIPGFHIGVTTEIHLIKKISIEPMILMSRKGFEAILPGTDMNSYALDYFSLQLLTKFHPLERLKIFIGGETSLLATVTTANSQFLDNNIFNRTDYSFVAGLEICPFENISIHAKYNLSLNNLVDFIATDQVGNPIGVSSFRNRVIMLGLTFYPFRFEMF